MRYIIFTVLYNLPGLLELKGANPYPNHMNQALEQVVDYP